ncbi:ABC transporter F family member 4-like isoform X1 [Carya illinoinensis]|uniref:ABC transporter F family member 4-like isoform X1 n=2 Tax=Carya illinoinensis TaxID=32201 RepID=UPI001C71D962|nr:ABC transporter F family member 4-like isoform X1 [Carya illinoinensis]
MLCSVPSPGKSGTNWLDRLRSNKGFLTSADEDNVDNNLGVDHFLHNQNPSESTRSNSGFTQSDHERVANRAGHEGGHQQQEKLYNIMSNVLSELFFMDGDAHIKSSKLSGKKFPRKQAIPKSLTTSTISNTHLQQQKQEEVKSPACASKDDNGPRTALLNSDNSSKETKEGNVGEEEEERVEEEEEEDKGERELVGYSRSEVTVIDTSFGVWKSDKVVYRRKNMWKVRQKREKVRSFGRKKRKLGSGVRDYDNGDDENFGGVMKKTKVSSSESVAALNQGQISQTDTKEDACKDKPDVLTQVPKKRQVHLLAAFHFSRSPRKSRKGGSPVILIKGIPTSKKQDEKPLRTCHKDAERKFRGLINML